MENWSAPAGACFGLWLQFDSMLSCGTVCSVVLASAARGVTSLRKRADLVHTHLQASPHPAAHQPSLALPGNRVRMVL